MKRSFLLSLLILFAVGTVRADVLTLGKCQVKRYNDVLKQMGYFDFEVQYDTKDGTIGFYFDHSLLPCELWMSPQQRDVVSALFAKYHEWDKMEVQKAVEIDKSMGKFSAHPYFKYGDWHSTDGDHDVDVTFFTRTVGNNEFVMVFDEWTAATNEYITHQEDTVYIEKDEIPLIEEWITDANIKKVLAEQKKKEDAEKDFK